MASLRQIPWIDLLSYPLLALLSFAFILGALISLHNKLKSKDRAVKDTFKRGEKCKGKTNQALNTYQQSQTNDVQRRRKKKPDHLYIHDENMGLRNSKNDKPVIRELVESPSVKRASRISRQESRKQEDYVRIVAEIEKDDVPKNNDRLKDAISDKEESQHKTDIISEHISTDDKSSIDSASSSNAMKIIHPPHDRQLTATTSAIPGIDAKTIDDTSLVIDTENIQFQEVIEEIVYITVEEKIKYQDEVVSDIASEITKEKSPTVEVNTLATESNQIVTQFDAEVIPNATSEITEEKSPTVVVNALATESNQIVTQFDAEVIPNATSEITEEKSPTVVVNALATESNQIVTQFDAEVIPNATSEITEEKSPTVVVNALATESNQIVTQFDAEVIPNATSEITEEKSPTVVVNTLATESNQIVAEVDAEVIPNATSEITEEKSPTVVVNTLATESNQIVTQFDAEVIPNATSEITEEKSPTVVVNTLATESNQIVAEVDAEVIPNAASEITEEKSPIVVVSIPAAGDKHSVVEVDITRLEKFEGRVSEEKPIEKKELKVIIDNITNISTIGITNNFEQEPTKIPTEATESISGTNLHLIKSSGQICKKDDAEETIETNQSKKVEIEEEGVLNGPDTELSSANINIEQRHFSTENYLDNEDIESDIDEFAREFTNSILKKIVLQSTTEENNYDDPGNQNGSFISDIKKKREPYVVSKYKHFILQKYAEKITDKMMLEMLPKPVIKKNDDRSLANYTKELTNSILHSVINEQKHLGDESSQKHLNTIAASIAKKVISESIVDLELEISTQTINDKKLELDKTTAKTIEPTNFIHLKSDISNKSIEEPEACRVNSERYMSQNIPCVTVKAGTGEIKLSVVDGQIKTDQNQNTIIADESFQKKKNQISDRPLSGYTEKLALLLAEEDDFDFDSDEDLSESLQKIKNNFSPECNITNEINNIQAQYSKDEINEYEDFKCKVRKRKDDRNNRKLKGDRPISLYAQDMLADLINEEDEDFDDNDEDKNDEEICCEKKGYSDYDDEDDSAYDDSESEEDDDVIEDEIQPVSETVVLLENQIPLRGKHLSTSCDYEDIIEDELMRNYSNVNNSITEDKRK